MLCVKGCRSAAVKLKRIHTACVKHNLCNFVVCCTDRIRSLTTVKNKHYNLSVLGDTYAASRHLLGFCIGKLIYAVLNKDFSAAYTLLYVILIGFVLGNRADYRCAIFKDGKEVGFIGVEGFTLHNKQAFRFTCAHVIEVCVCSDNYIIVFDVIIGIVGIGVLFLSGCHLFADG